MPLLNLQTNLPADKFNKEQAEALVKLISEKFEIKAEHLAIHVQADQKIFYAGSADPVAFVRVLALPDAFSGENIKKAHELITKKINEDLGVENKRIMVSLHPINPEHTSAGGKSLADLKAAGVI